MNTLVLLGAFLLSIFSVASAQSNQHDSSLAIVYPVPADTLPPTRSPLFMVGSLGAGVGGPFLGPASMSIVYYRIGPGVISLGGGGVSHFSQWEQFIEGPVEQVRSYRLSFGREIEWEGWSTTASIGGSYTLGFLRGDTGKERDISTAGLAVDLTAFPRTHQKFSVGVHVTGNINAIAPYVALMASVRFQFSR